MIRIMVTGVGGGVGQSVMKALRASTLDVQILAVDVDSLAAGLYRADVSAVVPRADAPTFADAIVTLAERHDIRAIIPGSDPELPALARARERIASETGAIVIVSSPEVIEIGWDKAATVAFLERHDLPRPRAASSLDAAVGLARDVGFPVIVKPRFGSASRGVVEVGDEEDLRRAWSRTSDPIVEECLTGDECTCGTFVDRDGHVRGVIVLRRWLQGGATYRASVERLPDVEGYVTAIAQRLGATGPCNIQLRIGPNGPVAFEFNPRFSGTTAIRTQAGFIEVEAAVRHFALGEDVPPLLTQPLVALRYWNEVFASPEEAAKLARGGTARVRGKVRPWP